MNRNSLACSDCESFDRRSFFKTAGAATLAGVAMPMLVGLPGLYAAPSAKSTAETTVSRFFASLSAEQKKAKQERLKPITDAADYWIPGRGFLGFNELW